MQQFDCLSPTLDVQGRYFLEASAGTGKTFAIEHLVTRLLLEKGLEIEQILVVTFTRAATRDLKKRIRANLHRALSELKSRNLKIAYLIPLLNEGEEALQEKIWVLERALIFLDEAPIQTIHSFCHRMLSEYSFEAKQPALLPSPDDRSQQDFLKETLHDFFRSSLPHKNSSEMQLRTLLDRMSFDQVLRELQKIVEGRGSFPEVPTFDEHFEVYTSLVKSMQQRKPLVYEKIMEDFENLSLQYKGLCRRDGTLKEIWQQQIHHLAKSHSETPKREHFEELLAQEKNALALLTEENRKKRGAKEVVLHYPYLWDGLAEKMAPLLEASASISNTLVRLGGEASHFVRKRQEEEGMQSPDDILVQMENSLQYPSFRNSIKEKYRAVIIDEFQDTDPLQWKIFKALFLDEKPVEAFYLVGDPKQSIYAFRNADLYTYLSAAKVLGEKSHAYLNVNYRSDPSLIHALNRLFSHEMQGEWLELPETGDAIQYYPVKPAPDRKDHPFEDQRGALHFFLAEDETAQFHFIADEILRLDEQNLPMNSLAILVKDRFQQRRLMEVMQKRNIPLSGAGIAPITETFSFELFELLFLALQDPSQLKKTKALFAHPFFRAPLGSFAEDSSFLALHEGIFWLYKMSEALEHRGIAGLIDFFFYEPIWESSSLLERIVSFHNLEHYSDLIYLAELLTNLEASKQKSASDFCDILEGMHEKSTQDPRLQRRPLSVDDAVEVMTIHMSKGLEFDVVFALGLSSEYRGKEVVMRHRNKWLRSDFDEAHVDAAMKELDAEKMRQLYVAMTRAKKRLYVPLLEKSAEGSPIVLFLSKLKHSHSSEMELLKALREEASISWEEVKSQGRRKWVQNREKVKLEAPPKLELFFSQKPILSFSSLAAKHETPRLVLEEAPELPTGAETGVLIHAIFEKMINAGLHHPFDQEAIRAVIHCELSASHLRDFEEDVYSIVKKTCHADLPFDDDSLILKGIHPKEMMTEMEFLYAKPDYMMKGFIDLVFLWNERVYIIDWKTNALPDYDREYLEAAMKSGDYFLQARLYEEALMRHLKGSRFGGTFYLFVRGIDPEIPGRGVYYVGH